MVPLLVVKTVPSPGSLLRFPRALDDPGGQAKSLAALGKEVELQICWVKDNKPV